MQDKRIRAAFIKTLFDNTVLPYKIENNELNVVKGKWYLINSKFGEDLGIAYSNVVNVDIEKYFSRRVNNQETDINELQNVSVINDNINVSNESENYVEIMKAELKEKKETQLLFNYENLSIIREATIEEVEEFNKYRNAEKDDFPRVLKEIKEENLDMKLINIHIMYKKKKVIFNFTAPNRVDFRNLVKRLASIYKTRIEMRQIGVRDAVKILGGYGVCGHIVCCQRSNCHINSVYLKMVKDQGFLINSSKLTGNCDRLMCCLAYEYNFYAEERKKYPEIGSLIIDNSKKYSVYTLNLFKKEIIGIDENKHQKKFHFDNIHFDKTVDGINYYTHYRDE